MIIEPADRDQYMNALAYADFNGDLKPLALFFCESMTKTYNDIITSLGWNEYVYTCVLIYSFYNEIEFVKLIINVRYLW